MLMHSHVLIVQFLAVNGCLCPVASIPNKTPCFSFAHFLICTLNKTSSLERRCPKCRGKLESKMGGPEPKTGEKLRPISISDLLVSFCVQNSYYHVPELHTEAVLLVQPYQLFGTIFLLQSLKQTVCLHSVVD